MTQKDTTVSTEMLETMLAGLEGVTPIRSSLVGGNGHE